MACVTPSIAMLQPKRDELRRLHFINALFAHVTGHDLYLAQQIKDAIAFSLAELEAQMLEHPEYAARYDTEFNASAAKLLSECFQTLSSHGFFHWDATRTLTSATPLFARAELMEGIKKLSPYRESTLLVTNLRPAFLPPEKRATPKRMRDYEDALDFIHDLAAARTPRFASLQLLFL
jgi:hypothetical protein